MAQPKNIETAILQLDTILSQMQQEETGLADAVKLYAKAADLIVYCDKQLADTQMTIEEIDRKLDSAQTEDDQDDL
ncbi:MAG: exodeoxyribonuclease VII small subunit [Oscillospiraceae bacterium]|nr:exodeoxyribonuclease VII small subunit [Oscillospiraceae bacterium]